MTPMLGMGNVFASSGGCHNVDPAFMLSISQHEKQLGVLSKASGTYNPFGYLHHSYDSWPKAIEDVTSFAHRLIFGGYKTVTTFACAYEEGYNISGTKASFDLPLATLEKCLEKKNDGSLPAQAWIDDVPAVYKGIFRKLNPPRTLTDLTYYAPQDKVDCKTLPVAPTQVARKNQPPANTPAIAAVRQVSVRKPFILPVDPPMPVVPTTELPEAPLVEFTALAPASQFPVPEFLVTTAKIPPRPKGPVETPRRRRWMLRMFLRFWGWIKGVF